MTYDIIYLVIYIMGCLNLYTQYSLLCNMYNLYNEIIYKKCLQYVCDIIHLYSVHIISMNAEILC